ncbi:putative zinc ribbon protein [Liquorilactobacillus uvarum]|uniref:putative zinc ribbon protein n=1 Tax=Liquorilactobacillus uvarum TaxID=303240 RepID=UPI00288AE705|nr:hypothetical protein [Liquorilactobacillus uvarum]
MKNTEWSTWGQEESEKGKKFYCPKCNHNLKGERYCPSCNLKITYSGEIPQNNKNIENQVASGIRKERYARNHGALAATAIIILGIVIAVLTKSTIGFWISGVIAFFIYQKMANKF